MKTWKPVLWTVLTVAALSVSASAQQEKPQRKARPEIKLADNSPVTQKETRAAFTRLEDMIRTVVDISGPVDGSDIPDNNSAVTRDQVISEFTRLYHLAEPKYKVTPKKVTYDEKRFNVSDAQRDNLKLLVGMGCVGKFSPLATSKGSSLSIKELGDAIGFFIARIADMTNLPSSKWTPYLHND